MDKLTQLAIKYKTDKWGKHNYTPVYYKLFENKGKRRAVKKVLEIGTAEGAGVYMYRDFFTHATIYGAEVDPKRVEMMRGKDRIDVMLCDQSKQIDLINLIRHTGADLDLVIDDGSHKPEDQLFTCLQLCAGLKKGAVYVIEDVADESIVKPIKEFFKNSDVQVLKLSPRYDDRLIIITR